jgi:hypothetical protein
VGRTSRVMLSLFAAAALAMSGSAVAFGSQGSTADPAGSSVLPDFTSRLGTTTGSGAMTSGAAATESGTAARIHRVEIGSSVSPNTPGSSSPKAATPLPLPHSSTTATKPAKSAAPATPAAGMPAATTSAPAGPGAVPALTTPVSAAIYDSDPGDYIGQGQYQSFDYASAFVNRFTSDGSAPSSIAGGAGSLGATFSAPPGLALTVGSYPGAVRAPFAGPGQPGLEVTGMGRGCNTITGSFTIEELTLAPDKSLLSFAVTFVQHCEGLPAALYGEIRFNSTVGWAVRQVVPATLAFATIVAGTTTSADLTIFNLGNVPLILPKSTISVTAAGTFSVTGGTCVSSTADVPVAPGDSCTVTVTADATTVLIPTATLTFVDNTARSGGSIRITASYSGYATVYVTPAGATSGHGGGRIVSSPAGIDCAATDGSRIAGSVCTGQFVPGLPIVLTATPDAASVFSAWSDQCTGAGSGPCTLTPTAGSNSTATASFVTGLLTVSAKGLGSGSVTSSPGTINCSQSGYGACVGEFVPGSSVTLTATQTLGQSVFDGWRGTCIGSAPCTFTIPAGSLTIEAWFEPGSTFANLVGDPQLVSTPEFAGISDSTGCASPPCVEAGDSSLAVGPDAVVQAAAGYIRVTDRTGSQLGSIAYSTFFGEPADQLVDGEARVVWDSLHWRWVAIEMSGDCAYGYIYLAVSDTSDPTGWWSVYGWYRSGGLWDMPSVGFSSDKVVISGNVFDSALCGSPAYRGAQLIAVDEAQLLTAPPQLPWTSFGPTANLFAWRPSVGMSPASDLPAVVGRIFNDDLIAGVARLTGTIADGDIALSTVYTFGYTDVSPFMYPLVPVALSGGPMYPLAQGPIEALARDGTMWFVSGTACSPGLDTLVRSCIRIAGVTMNAPSGYPVILDQAIGVTGYDSFGGGIGMTAGGALVVTWSQASATAPGPISSHATYRTAGQEAWPNAFHTPILVESGAGTYAGHYWADHVSVAADPGDPRAVWVAPDLSTGSGDWATHVFKLSQTEATPPAAPVGVEAVIGDGSADITWSPPPSDGGSEITAYHVTTTPATTGCAWASGPYGCTLTGLTNGVRYTVTVTATNGIGTGPGSEPLLVIHPIPPEAPTGVSAVGRDSSIQVSWSPPATDGGSDITGYTATAQPGDHTCPWTSGPLTCTITGLTNRSTYTVTVTATNALGTGPASDPGVVVAVVAGSTYYPVAPCEAATYVVLDANVAQAFPVAGLCGVAPDASAVTGTLIVGYAMYKGWVALTPAPLNGSLISTINFPANDWRSTGVTVPLAADGSLTATYGAPSGNLVAIWLEITGYFETGSGGATYSALTPNRILDSRPSGSGHVNSGLAGMFVTGVPRMLQVTGRTPRVAATNVPSDAVAVTGTLTVTNQTSRGFITIEPYATYPPVTAALFFPTGDNRATSLTVGLGGGGTVSLTYWGSVVGARADVIFDVTGYFAPGAAGATYVPITPKRLVDNRVRVGLTAKLRNHIAATFAVINRTPLVPATNIPTGAVAVTGTLTVTGQSYKGWLAITNNPTNYPPTSTLNFPVGDNRATGVTVPLSAGGNLSITYGAIYGATTFVVFDVTGYFIR